MGGPARRALRGPLASPPGAAGYHHCVRGSIGQSIGVRPGRCGFEPPDAAGTRRYCGSVDDPRPSDSAAGPLVSRPMRVLRELGRGAAGSSTGRGPDHPERALALKLILGDVARRAVRFQREAEESQPACAIIGVVVHSSGSSERSVHPHRLRGGTGLETVLRGPPERGAPRGRAPRRGGPRVGRVATGISLGR